MPKYVELGHSGEMSSEDVFRALFGNLAQTIQQAQQDAEAQKNNECTSNDDDGGD